MYNFNVIEGIKEKTSKIDKRKGLCKLQKVFESYRGYVQVKELQLRK